MNQQSNAALELDLADRARQGDGDALSELYQRYQTALLRHAWRMLGDEASAADVVQEAFARAIMAMPRTRGRPLLFKAWIYRIATNLCLRELTRRSRVAPRPTLTAQDESQLSPEQDGPEKKQRHKQLGAMVQRVLKQLPDRYRQILLLREFEELSYEELAKVLHLNKTTVKVTLHRARARFAALFVAEQLYTDPEAVSSIGCRQLRRLVEQDRKRRSVERHLEQCPHCHDDRRKPGELLLLLPPIPELAVPPPSAAQLAQAAAAGKSTLLQAAASKVGLATAATTLAAAAVVVATTMTPSNGSTSSRVAPPERQVRQATSGPRTVAAGQRGSIERVGAALPKMPKATQPSKKPRKKTAKKTMKASSKAARRSAAGKNLARRDRQAPAHSSQAVDPEDPDTEKRSPKAASSALRLKLRFVPNTVRVRRAGTNFMLTRKTTLARGDLLDSGKAHDLAMLLAGHQWIAVRGVVKLLEVGRRGQPVERAQVQLVAGELRARASRKGKGIIVHHRRSRCTIQQGEMRLRVVKAGLKVAAISAHVLVSGPHARRTVAPGSGLLLGRRPGFAHALLPRVIRLRPASHRGSQAPLLRWSPVSGASRYRVLIGGDADFLLPEEQSVVERLQYRPRTKRKGKHFWKVVALGGGKQGSPSKVFSFDIE